MSTIIDKILQPREINVDKIKLFDLLSDSTVVIPGISNLNLEKSLSSVVPSIQIENIEMEELFDKFVIKHNIKFSFSFDVSKFEEFLMKYFKIRISSYSSDNPNQLINIQQKSLFYDKNYTSKKEFSFSSFRKKEFQDRFEYKSSFQTEINKNKNGEFFIAPSYIFQVLKVYFDEDSFNKEFDINELGFDENNNGKSILISYFDNDVYNPYQLKITTEDTVEWQSSFNVKDGEHYTYSFFTSDARKLLINQESIKNKIKLLSDFPNLNLSEDVNNSSAKKYISFYNKEYFTYPISLFFDIDWYNLCLDKTIYKSLLLNNENLISNFSIQNITIKKHTENNVELLGSISISEKQLINFEDNKIKLKESILDNQLVKTFHLIDQTANLTNFNGKVMYSIELTIKSALESLLEEKNKEIQKAYKEIQNYNFQFENLTDKDGEFVGDVKIDVDESLYVKSLETYYNNLPLLKKIDVRSELEREYNNSNPTTGTSKGRNKFQENIKQLNDSFTKLSSFNNSYVSGKKLSKTQRSLFSYEQKTKWVVLTKEYFDVLPNPDILEYTLSEINNYDFSSNIREIKNNKQSQNNIDNLFQDIKAYDSESKKFQIINSLDKQKSNNLENSLEVIEIDDVFKQQNVEISSVFKERTIDELRYFYYFDGMWKEIDSFSELTDESYLCKVEFLDNRKIGNNVFLLGENKEEGVNFVNSFVSLKDINELRII